MKNITIKTIDTNYLGVRLSCTDFIDFCKQMKAHFKHPYDVEWAKNETDWSVIAAKQAVNNMLSLIHLAGYWNSLIK